MNRTRLTLASFAVSLLLSATLVGQAPADKKAKPSSTTPTPNAKAEPATKGDTSSKAGASSGVKLWSQIVAPPLPEFHPQLGFASCLLAAILGQP